MTEPTEALLTESGVRDVVAQARALVLEGCPCGICKTVRLLADECERLRGDNADLRAANLSSLLSEIKERLTPEEGQQFQSLLMSATRGWVDEVTGKD